MENNMPPIPEESKQVVEVEQPVQEETKQEVKIEQPVNKMDQKTILTIVAIALGALAFILRGLAIYHLVFAFVVLFISIGSLACAIVSYQKEVLISLIALILGVSACGSAVSLITSFIAEALYAPVVEEEEIDFDDLFNEFYGIPGEGEESSDYFWD